VMPPKRILLVDDYPDALEIWGLYLRLLGYDVDTADDGLKAVEQAHRRLPDLIVLDLELPGISGFEAARQLRQSADTAAIPLIAATGYSHVKQLDHARDCGFDSIVVKPCEPAALWPRSSACSTARRSTGGSRRRQLCNGFTTTGKRLPQSRFS
jgi:CheY-like chemotaxis protein